MLVPMFVDFRWASQILIENGKQDVVVLGVCWPCPVIGVHQMHTSGSGPVTDIIKGAGLDILYLMDVFYVV